MKTKIQATKIELTPQIKNYVQTKMDMLEKYLGNVQVLNCDVQVELTTQHHQKGKIYRAEINLEVPQKLLRVTKVAETLFKAIDKAKDHMADSIKKYKEKKVIK
ncbi:MAG: ribosome-associated translation inhibitor RaiA [Patescibacteria group bacterium]|nr:ribosome-associated translation inhibitor RaiA [Patescibacteria group bacterium]MBU1160809.1 ribosome-associated translation inhibitor RaiA [Patescibacteria group bacterium]MBU1349613.1 ribosome-associated translation inhibitor RaiA [Patescibacteria group bacterium]MBU1420923.1 ribosome-associated translation inhibitor RaiA [Patescibacteria group bacterium]MBU1683956.1 ribosome-associated translation inhibitor RaiA [Patescibacteria group bacterium]